MTCCGNKPPVQTYCVPFAGFTEFVASIPKLYFGVKSQEQRILAICEQLNKLICFVDYQGEKINLNRADIDWLMAEFKKFKESGFDDYYLEQIENWVNTHMQQIIEQAIKMVFFGLTLDGYFCAWVPRSWQGILFDTIADYANENYGCLVLNY